MDLSAWRTSYRNRRYLNKAHVSRLKARVEHLLANIWWAPGKGPPQAVPDPWRTILLERLAHTAEELTQRGDPQHLPSTLDALVQCASLGFTPVDAFGARRLPTAPYLVRFSELKFIKDAWENGRFRIGPAASYNDSSLNAAQKDDELTHFTVTGERAVKFKIYGYAADASPEEVAKPKELQARAGELFEYSNIENFYVLCLTDRYDARMFHDFKADAAIVITDPRVFLKRIGKAVGRTLNCGFEHKQVHYYDPYQDQRDDLKPPFCKNFSFAYQKEYRLAWRPKTRAPLAPIFVEIGPMRDISFMIRTSP